MVIVADLAVEPEFADAEIDTVPAPLPLAPLTMEIHGVALDEVHEQAADVATLIDADPPEAGSVCEVGETLKPHVVAA
jgi:hypothetical protein